MRVSATTLESFRLFMTEDWMDEAQLVASIRGEFVPTHEVKLGKAYHSILEEPERHQMSGGFACDGFSFDDATMRPMLDAVDRRGVFEVKTSEQIGDVTLVTRADHVFGTHINEFKTTCGSFDVDRYLNSYQWRVMALLFQASSVTYRVACLNDHGNGVVELKSIEAVTVYPYEALRLDCVNLLHQFCGYVTAKGLDGLLRERQQKAMAA